MARAPRKKKVIEDGERARRPARQPVTVHYRRLSDATGAFGAESLEGAIRKAMNHHTDSGKVSDHWNQRAYVIPPSAEDTLLMNVFHDGGDFYFGDLTQFTKGFMQALLAGAGDTPSLAVEQQPPPEGKEYVHSMMYWLAVKSHLLMIQSRSLSAKELELYLTWLLKDRTTAIGPTGQVILQTKFDADEVGGDLDNITEIIIGGTAVVGSPVMAKRAPSVPVSIEKEVTGFAEDAAVLEVRETERYDELVTRKPFYERAIDVLRAVMNNEADVQKLLDSVPEGANLDVSVHIGYKSRRRHISRAPMQEALRNLPEGEITARGPGGRMTGNDIRLSHRVNVLKIGSLLDPEDVVRALREAYQHFLDNGKITAG